MKCFMCNEEIEQDNMTTALSLGNYPPATSKEIPVHIKCPHYHGWKFYGGLTQHALDGACPNCGDVDHITRNDIKQCESCGYPSPASNASR